MLTLTSPMIMRLHDENIVLRPYRSTDFQAYYKLQSSPEVVQHMLWRTRGRQQSADHFASTRIESELVEDGDLIAWAIEHRGTVVGEITLFMRRKAANMVEIGWIVDPEHQGKGYAKAAANAVMRMAFDGLNVNKIIAEIDTRNFSSTALAMKLGFSIEALLRQNRMIEGEYINSYILGKLATD